ncbi:MAG: S8 family serine peptidase [Lachnospiraceae bacterium]|nr:S8 family serine peptidase [Lachnospiraceae bacterium]
MLIFCMTAGSLPWMSNAGTAGRKQVSENTVNSENTDIVHGFGNKIKEKKQKEVKVKVNQDNKNGKAWNHQMIQANVTGESAEKIKVAIIDSGINFSTDLPVAVRKNFIPEDERSVLYEDPSGHGTAVAGIIAALDNDEGITGINPDVELYSARVLDAKLEAPVERIVETIDWAIEQDVDIINMSFGIAKNVKEL